MKLSYDAQTNEALAKLQPPTLLPSSKDIESTNTVKEKAGAHDENACVGNTEAPEQSLSVSYTQQRWNHPRSNVWRILATFLGFFVMGLNDGAYGVSHNRLFMMCFADHPSSL